MSDNSVLFRWHDIDWTLAKCLAVSGVFLILVAAGLFFVLFKHVKGKVERMSKEEALDFALNATKTGADIQTTPLWGAAVGVKAELNCNIDSLRQAARRGDWLTFWLWPVILSCSSLGFWLAFMAFAFLRREPILVGSLTLVSAFIVFVAWFMPWAATHTQIDLNASIQPPARSGDRASPPQR